MDDGFGPAIPLLPRASFDTRPTSPYKTNQRRPEDEDIVNDPEDTATLVLDHPVSPSPPTSAAPRIRRRRRRPQGLREILHALLERPNSSQAAFTIHLMVNALILLSALLTVLETLPFVHHVSTAVWFGLETTIVICFTFEYIARAIAWSESYATFWGWFSSFFGIVDLLAILPYYIEIALRADTTAFFRFSILRTIRLLRVFRPFKYSSTLLLTIEVMLISIRRSRDALLALAFFVLMVLVVFSTLLYFAERGTWDESLETFIDDDGQRSAFESIPAAAWFVLVTITTVGYGEIIPRSFLGRLITIPLLLFGLLLIALPSFVLGREFAIVWEEMGPGVVQSLSNGHDRIAAVEFDDGEHLEGQPEQAQALRSRYRPGSGSQSRATPFMGSLHARSPSIHWVEVEAELRLLRKEREEVSKVLAELREEVRALRVFRQSVTS